ENRTADGVGAGAGVHAPVAGPLGGSPATDRSCAVAVGSVEYRPLAGPALEGAGQARGPIPAGLLQQVQDRTGLLAQVLLSLRRHRPRTVRVIQMTNEPLHRPPGRHRALFFQMPLGLLQSTRELMGIDPG